MPAAFKEWSLPLDELPLETQKLAEQNVPEAKRLLAEAGYPGGFKTTIETTAGYGPDWMDAVQIALRNWKAVGIDAELRLKEYGAYISSTLLGKFEHMAVGLFGAWTDPDSYLYRYYMPGQPSNAGGVSSRGADGRNSRYAESTSAPSSTGQNVGPANTSLTSCSRNRNEVTTPKLPPPPRIAQ